MRKYFSLAEAENLIPKIDKIMKKLLQIKAAISAVSSIDISYTDESEDMLGFARSNKEYHRLSFKFYSEFENLNKLGCVLKDLDYGLVDFYSIYKGFEILFCYRYGEKSIKYWHSIEGGFIGRRKVSELKL